MIMGWVKGVKLCFDYILETLKYFKEPIHEICVYALLVRLLSMLQDFWKIVDFVWTLILVLFIAGLEVTF